MARELPQLGRRGEGWVALQVLLLAVIIAAGILGPAWPTGVHTWLSVVGGTRRPGRPVPVPRRDRRTRAPAHALPQAGRARRDQARRRLSVSSVTRSTAACSCSRSPGRCSHHRWRSCLGPWRVCSSTPSGAARRPGSSRRTPATRSTVEACVPASCRSCGDRRAPGSDGCQDGVERLRRTAVHSPMPAPKAVCPSSMIRASRAASPLRSPNTPMPQDGYMTSSGNRAVAAP